MWSNLPAARMTVSSVAFFLETLHAILVPIIHCHQTRLEEPYEPSTGEIAFPNSLSLLVSWSMFMFSCSHILHLSFCHLSATMLSLVCCESRASCNVRNTQCIVLPFLEHKRDALLISTYPRNASLMVFPLIGRCGIIKEACQYRLWPIACIHGKHVWSLWGSFWSVIHPSCQTSSFWMSQHYSVGNEWPTTLFSTVQLMSSCTLCFQVWLQSGRLKCIAPPALPC